MTPVIYRPGAGPAYPLLIPGGEGLLVPAVAEEPCDCCGFVYQCGQCGNEVLPSAVTLNVRGMDNPHPFAGCRDCDELNGSYFLDQRSELGCGWSGTFGVNVCQGVLGQANQVYLGVGIDATTVAFIMRLLWNGSTVLVWSRVWQRQSSSCLADLAAANLIMGRPTNSIGQPQFETCEHNGPPWDLSF